MEHLPDPIVWIGIVGRYPIHRDVRRGFGLAEALDDRWPWRADHLGLNADLLQTVLEQLCGLLALGKAGQEMNFERTVDFAARFGELRLGLLEVERVTLDVPGITPNGIWQRCRVAFDQTTQDVLVETVIVEDVVDRASDADIVQGCPRRVELHHHHAHGFSVKHLSIARGFNAFQLIGLQIAADTVEVAFHQAEHARVRVLDGAELDLIEILRAPALEMTREALRHETDGRVELFEFIGTRAGAVLREPGRTPVAIDFVLLDERGIEDVDLRDDGQEDRRGFRELEANRIVINGFGFAGLDHRLEE